MKFSNEEKRVAEFILEHRNILDSEKKLNNLSEEEKLKPFKFILVDNVKDNKIKEKLKELLKYINKLDLIEYFDNWDIPIIPVTGDMLVERNVKKGPLFSKILNTIKEIWKNEFKMDTSEDTKNKLLVKCDELVARS